MFEGGRGNTRLTRHKPTGIVPLLLESRFTGQLKCIYANACSMGNKEELEAIV